MADRPKTARRNRAASKRLRRQQLIRSTIESIARRGFADTTLANVADGAGLSRGIVNFHFQSKEMLLDETLQYLAEEYRSLWTRALTKAGPAPAHKLASLVMADADPTVYNRKKIAVWYAFYGEAKSRPTYLKLCDDRDREYFAVLRDLCQQLLDEDGHAGVDANQIATGLSAMTDGLWLNHLLKPRKFSRRDARETLQAFLASLFPNHFAVTLPEGTSQEGGRRSFSRVTTK